MSEQSSIPAKKTVFKTLSVDVLETDPLQPREEFNTEGDKNRLKLSLQQLGMQQPIAVLAMNSGIYRIIDGHRRVLCAREIGMNVVPCLVYSHLLPGEIERIRYDLQNNRRLWKPLERASALINFKKSTGSTNKEAAEQLFISETLVSNSLKLGELKSEYGNLMKKYGLTPSYQIEFVKLRPKLRQIEEYTIDDIIQTLFERVSNQVIRTSKDFRTLGRIFLRANANMDQIHTFLSDPDMTVKQLEEKTVQSGFSLLLEQSIKKILTNQVEGVPFSSHEKHLLVELHKALQLHFVEKRRSESRKVKLGSKSDN